MGWMSLSHPRPPSLKKTQIWWANYPTFRYFLGWGRVSGNRSLIMSKWHLSGTKFKLTRHQWMLCVQTLIEIEKLRRKESLTVIWFFVQTQQIWGRGWFTLMLTLNSAGRRRNKIGKLVVDLEPILQTNFLGTVLQSLTVLQNKGNCLWWQNGQTLLNSFLKRHGTSPEVDFLDSPPNFPRRKLSEDAMVPDVVWSCEESPNILFHWAENPRIKLGYYFIWR